MQTTEQAEKIWKLYTASWKVKTMDEKLNLFAKSLDQECEYKDPTINTKGWNELAENMMNFHDQIPGGHFVTTYFHAHSGKSLAKWDMCTGEGIKIGEGVSFGEYNRKGKLTSMTGFFET